MSEQESSENHTQLLKDLVVESRKLSAIISVTEKIPEYEREQIKDMLVEIAAILLKETKDRRAFTVPEASRALHELLSVSVC